ncbi:MAG: aminoacetone oxidase family FAD-binding enzyme [Planctomycetes bacterium]|nr:aminoacetone oxidase family FAD-binding enzyme [Planctomycetota bacterium]
MMRIAVVGAGPAGLMAAIAAARPGVRVVLFEKNDEPGKKLLITGGGHCNLSNTLPVTDWPERFGKRGRFILPALTAFPQDALRRWLGDRGIPTEAPDGRHWYPATRSARDVRKALQDAATEAGVEWRYRTGVDAVEALSDGFRIGGDRFDRLVLACGGLSYPGTGSTWDGCRMAEALGHTVVLPVPALVGLRARNAMTDLAGLVFETARVFVKVKGVGTVQGRGELLLTHNDISGPAVLDLSGTVAEALARLGDAAEVAVRVEWLDGKDVAAWQDEFAEWRRTRGRSAVAVLLRDFFPNRFARELCRLAGIGDDRSAATLPAGNAIELAEALAGFQILVTGTEGFAKAIVTRGGVKTGKIDPATLASRRVEGLYFAGEMIDVDGPCGGFNLHWALASGRLAGENAART